jgi:hypothetical protein
MSCNLVEGRRSFGLNDVEQVGGATAKRCVMMVSLC